MIIEATPYNNPPRVDLDISAAPDGKEHILRRNLIPNPSFEVDTSGWVGSGVTVAKQTADPAPYSRAGTSSCLATVTATSGESFVYTQDQMPIGAGTEYLALSLNRLDYTKAYSGEHRVNFYTAAGAAISSIDGSNQYYYIGSTVKTADYWYVPVPPGAGKFSLSVGIATRPSGAKFSFDGVLVTELTSPPKGEYPRPRMNLCANPHLETNMSSWAIGGRYYAVNGGSARVVVPPVTMGGAKALQLTWGTVDGTATYMTYSPTGTGSCPVKPGDKFTVAVTVHNPNVWDLTNLGYTYLSAYDLAGVAQANIPLQNTAPVAAKSTVRLSWTFDIPNGVYYVRPWMFNSASLPPGTVWYVDQVVFTTSADSSAFDAETTDMAYLSVPGIEYQLTPEGYTVELDRRATYFDGATEPFAADASSGGIEKSHRWSGTEHSSASEEYFTFPANSVTAKSVVTLIVGGEEIPVRAGDDIVNDSVGFLSDYNTPTGVEMIYRITTYSADGQVTGVAETAVPAIADPPLSHMWISDAYVENSARLIQCTATNDDTRTWKLDYNTVVPMGSKYPIASIFGARQVSPFKLSAFMKEKDAPDLRRLLQSPVLCIRPPHREQLPPIIFGVGDLNEDPWRRPERPVGYFSRVDMDLISVMPPKAEAVIPAWTWQSVNDTSTTWQNVNDTYATWLEVLRGIYSENYTEGMVGLGNYTIDSARYPIA